MSMKPVCYNIPEELDQRIRDLAEEEGRSLSAMATMLLEKALGAKSKKSLARPKATETDFQVASFIHLSILNIKPNLPMPNLAAWAEECRKMREIDGRDPRRICEVFKWANNDPFWQANILSPAKLRKQFDQLELKANQVRRNERPTIATDDTSWFDSSTHQRVVQAAHGHQAGMETRIPGQPGAAGRDPGQIQAGMDPRLGRSQDDGLDGY